MKHEIKQEQGKDVLCFYLEGQLDSSTTSAVEETIEKAVMENPDLPLMVDAKELAYVSSAGLRLFLKLSKAGKDGLRIVNVTPAVYEVLDVTGFTKLLDITRVPREVSVKGCEVIGKGAYGTVYRIDPDTVIKAYENVNAVDLIQREQRLSKLAFLKGIPTAISYDIVKVGPWYGSMFEMIKAKTLNDLLIEDFDRQDELIRIYAQVMRQVHSVEMEPGVLPDNKVIFKGYLDAVREVLPMDIAHRLEELLEAMPEDMHLVHGDFHMKNIMLSEGEPVLIDMETIGTGDPVFDFAGIFVSYELFGEDDSGNAMQFFKIPHELGDIMGRLILEAYVGQMEGEREERILDRIRTCAYLRFIFLVHVMGAGGPVLKEVRIQHSIAHLAELLERVDCMSIRELLEN